MALFNFRRSNIPLNDVEFLSKNRRIYSNYKISKYLVNSYPPETMLALIEELNTVLNEMYEQKVDKNPTVKKMKDARNEHKKALHYVKGYLSEKFGKDNAVRYYEEFGIKKSSQGYTLPMAQEAHADGLNKLILGIHKYGFADNTYGAGFWEPRYNAYKALLATNDSTTGNISDYIARKNNLKKELDGGLNSIKLVVKANEPVLYSSEIRKLGYLNERYSSDN